MLPNMTPRGRARGLLYAVSTSAAAIAAGLATPASAQCSPDPTVPGETTTCTGTDADGLTVGSGSGFGVPSTIDVQAGAMVNPGVGDAGAITLGAPMGQFSMAVLNNSGTIQSASGPAIAAAGDPGRTGITTLVNAEGAVIAGATGGVNVAVASLVNHGLIDGGLGSAYGYSSSPDGGAVVFPSTLVNSGTMVSNSAAATLAGYSLPPINNTGRIENLGLGMAADGGSYSLGVSNSATGVIATAGPIALSSTFQVSVANDGVITGAIIGGSGFFGDRIDNADGQINGGVQLNGGNDHLIGRLGATSLVEGISGTIDGGDGDDVLELYVHEDRTLAATPVLPSGFEVLQLDLANDATLTLAAPPAPGGYYIRGTGTVEIGADIATTGRVINPTYIQINLGFEELNFTNAYTITTTLDSPMDAAIRMQSVGSANNSGTITANGGNGVVFSYANGDTTFTNSGTITATGTAVTVSRGFVNTGTVRSTSGVAVSNDLGGGTMRGHTSTNSGTIEGVTTGYALSMLVLQNSGLISASDGIGLTMSGAALDNLSDGVISGTTAAIRTDGFWENYIANAGTINGDVDFGSTSQSSNAPDWFIDRGGIVNGNVLMGGGDDVFVSALGNTSAVTGTIDGGAGFDTFLHTTSTDASATIGALRPTFEAIGYAVLDGAQLTLTAPAPLASTLMLAGQGTIDLAADLTGSTSPLIRLGHTLPPFSGLGEEVGIDLRVISRGTLTASVQSDQAPPFQGFIAGELSSSFENAGTIQMTVLPMYGTAAIQAWGEVINSGTIAVTGGTAVRGGDRLVNSGTIEQSGSNGAPAVQEVAEVINSGTISSAGSAVSVAPGGRLVNSGIVLSTAGLGVVSSYGGTVENAAGGQIAGTIGVAMHGGVVVNSGSIEGSIRLDYTPWGGVGTGYSSGAYVAAGGTVAGDVVFGGNSDLFLQVGESTGVSGVIDGGGSIDAFGRVYSHDATVDLAGPLGGVNFETQMIFASGADTTVTLTSATPYGETPWIGGDGRIVNQATVGSIHGYQPYFAFQPPSEFALDATLAEFRNEGTILGGFSGSVASFVNTGQISDGDDEDEGVDLYAGGDLRFENSGTILGAGGEQGVEIWTSTAASVTAINSGAVTGNFSVEIGADDPEDTAVVAFGNSGSITTTEEDTDALNLAAYYVGGTIAIDNSGTMSAAGSQSQALSLAMDPPSEGAPITYAITNSGTIEANGGGETFTYGLPYFDPPVTVSSTAGAIEIAGSWGVTGTIVNTATGRISATGALSTAVSMRGPALDLSNAGEISGSAGQTLEETDLLGFFNGTRFLAGAVQAFGESDDVIRNSGTIVGSIDLGAGDDRIDNTGSITGDVFLRDGNDQLANSGTLTGNVDFGAGDDVLELGTSSIIAGTIDLGAGADSVRLAGAGTDAGHVAATVNAERLEVASGSWRAEEAQSEYGLVTIAQAATLTVVENAEGSLALDAATVELNGVLNLDFGVDDTEGDLGETTITGGGQLHLIGTATVELTDATGLQHTGGTFVDNGELLLTTEFGGDVTTTGEGVFELSAGGDFTGDLVNNGLFVFSREDDYSFAGDFSGTGALHKHGAGTLAFDGLYAFEGMTQIFNGLVKFTGRLAEDTEVDLSGGVFDLSEIDGGEQTIAKLSGDGGTLQLGETNLIIDQAVDSVFAGEIEGTGMLQKEGEGDLKLEGDGTDFTGTGQVNGGTLSVNGNFENANFVVNEGGTLGGSGTIGETSVNGGTLAPGNSIDTLTVNGDLTFTATSVFEVEVNAAGQGDRVNATGQATLGGARVDVIAENGTYRPLTDYTILTAAGGISGTFSSVQDNLAFLDPSLIYSTNAVTLRLVRNDIDFSAFATTANQTAIANLIESFGYGNTLYNETLTLVDRDVAVSFASLTGEVYPTYGASLIETAEMLRRQTTDATQATEGAYAWATGLYNRVEGGDGASALDLSGQGVAGGFGYGGGGFSVSAGIGTLDQDSGAGRLSDAEGTFAIGRIGYSGLGGLSVSAGAQFGSFDGTAHRHTSLGAIDRAVTGEIEGDYVQLFGELAYRIPVGGGFGLEPFAAISHVSVELDGVTEAGAATALAVSAINRDVTFADLGLRLSGAAADGVRPFASAAYRHAWGDRASLATVGFAGTPGTVLISTMPIAESGAELSAGLVVTRGAIDFEVGYEGTVSETFKSHGVNAGLKIRF